MSNGWQSTDVSSSVVDGVLELRASCPAVRVDLVQRRLHDRHARRSSVDDRRVRTGAGARDDRRRSNIDGDDGAVELDDIAGDITVSNDNGRIIGRRLTSSTVDAQNTNGRIELSFLDPPQTVSARTENGRIDVVVPDTDVLYRVDLHTEQRQHRQRRPHRSRERSRDRPLHPERLDHPPSPWLTDGLRPDPTIAMSERTDSWTVRSSPSGGVVR